MVNEIFFVLYAKANFLCHLIVLKNWGNFTVCSACQLYQSFSVIKNVTSSGPMIYKFRKEANRSK